MARAKKDKAAGSAKSEDTAQPEETVQSAEGAVTGPDTGSDTAADDPSLTATAEDAAGPQGNDSPSPEGSDTARPDADETGKVDGEDVPADGAAGPMDTSEPDPARNIDTPPDADSPETTPPDTLPAEETPPAEPVLHAEDTMGGDTPEMAYQSGEDRIAGGEAPHAVAPEPQVIRETVVERKGGVVPMVLGGLVAAALGFGAAQFTDMRLPFLPDAAPDPALEAARVTLDQQADRLASLETQLADTRSAVEVIDMQPVTSALAGLEDSLAETNAAVSRLEDRLAAFESRMTALEKQPLADAVSPEAIAAYERELEDLRGAIEQQREAVAAQRAEIERMAAEAVAAEQGAEQQAQLAETRTALAEVTALVQDGRPYDEPLATISAAGITVPQPLAAQAGEGVPTLAALATDFPDAARDALRAARSSGEGQAGGLGAFLQNQLGARSVQPREGDDPDAVLSRAEAAVKDGDIGAALSEIAKLPEQAQAEMSDWVARAEARRDALAAASDLARQINQE